MQGLVLTMDLALQDRRRKAKAQQRHHGAEGRFKLQQMAEAATHAVAQGHEQILEGAAVGGCQATHHQPNHRWRQSSRQARCQQPQRQARDQHRDQQAQRAQPQSGGLHALDAAQIGSQPCREEQQRQAHQMQRLELQRAQGLATRQ